MILFEPVLRNANGTIASGQTVLKNKVNKSLSEQLKNIFSDKFCEIHKDIDSILEVDMKTQGEPIAEIKSCCCDEFRDKLTKICSNQNPFL